MNFGGQRSGPPYPNCLHKYTAFNGSQTQCPQYAGASFVDTPCCDLFPNIHPLKSKVVLHQLLHSRINQWDMGGMAQWEQLLTQLPQHLSTKMPVYISDNMQVFKNLIQFIALCCKSFNHNTYNWPVKHDYVSNKSQTPSGCTGSWCKPDWLKLTW
jgi:hypothetical protein